MKKYRNARVTWIGDHSHLRDGQGDAISMPIIGDVFINGPNAVVNSGGSRVERILDVEVTEVNGKKPEQRGVDVTGRSEHLAKMRLHPDDQKVTVQVRGGKCATC